MNHLIVSEHDPRELCGGVGTESMPAEEFSLLLGQATGRDSHFYLDPKDEQTVCSACATIFIERERGGPSQ